MINREHLTEELNEYLLTHSITIDRANLTKDIVDIVMDLDKTKPPLGLRPRYIADEERLQEITKAMARYSAAEIPIPSEWIAEMIELHKKGTA